VSQREHHVVHAAQPRAVRERHGLAAVDHVVELDGTEIRSRGGIRGTLRPGTSVRLRFVEESCALVDLEGDRAR
jgi:hypothetical protein